MTTNTTSSPIFSILNVTIEVLYYVFVFPFLLTPPLPSHIKKKRSYSKRLTMLAVWKKIHLYVNAIHVQVYTKIQQGQHINDKNPVCKAIQVIPTQLMITELL